MSRTETVIARDKYGNKVFLIKNAGPGYDLMTDGRIYLSPSLAKKLASKLATFAERRKKAEAQ